MKTVRDLRLWPVWVNPDHSIESATILMKGHSVAGLGVLHGDTFLGTVGIEDLVGVPPQDRVESVMKRDVGSVSLDMPLRRVAETMAVQNLPRLPVVDNGRFLGIITAQELLRDFGRNFDPLTHLPWSDTLRDWGIAQLKANNEITIIFLDLDDFGIFNKRFGHIVGDAVLRRVADELKEATDPELDHLCRAGGDEFCIGTLRPRGDAELLAQWIQRSVADLTVEGAGMAVTATFGVQGGRRTKERENIHFAATVDNLVNLASRECMAHKAKRQAAEGALPPTGRRFVELPALKALSQIPEENGAVVVLSLRDQVAAGMKSRCKSTIEAAAFATSLAIQKLVHNAGRIELHDVTIHPDGVEAIGTLDDTAVAARAENLSEPHEAAVRAVINAFQAVFEATAQ